MNRSRATSRLRSRGLPASGPVGLTPSVAGLTGAAGAAAPLVFATVTTQYYLTTGKYPLTMRQVDRKRTNADGPTTDDRGARPDQALRGHRGPGRHRPRGGGRL